MVRHHVDSDANNASILRACIANARMEKCRCSWDSTKSRMVCSSGKVSREGCCFGQELRSSRAHRAALCFHPHKRVSLSPTAARASHRGTTFFARSMAVRMRSLSLPSGNLSFVSLAPRTRINTISRHKTARITASRHSNRANLTLSSMSLRSKQSDETTASCPRFFQVAAVERGSATSLTAPAPASITSSRRRRS